MNGKATKLINHLTAVAGEDKRIYGTKDAIEKLCKIRKQLKRQWKALSHLERGRLRAAWTMP